MTVNNLDLSTYTYDLPEEKIAKFPLEDRAGSRLLFYNRGIIHHHQFDTIPNLLPKNTHLVFNNTKVIPARIIFYKDTGARIEIFLLDPVFPSNVYETVMCSRGACEWHVMIGNARKWKVGSTLHLELDSVLLSAKRTGEDTVRFEWEGSLSFSELLGMAGKVPLPPYLGREATEADIPRYQTVYSKIEGAVAAPTAGLHFTDATLTELSGKGISTDYLTLHVSAGTFQPIKTGDITSHPMHREQVVITRSNVDQLMHNEEVIPVGTTSMRTIESLYWFGNALSRDPDASFFIPRLAPYESDGVSKQEALEHVMEYMRSRDMEQITGHTEIFILPGYKFRICKGLVTNFHLPGSTLILLVAALVGEDWKRIYQEALTSNYRFLSYGDSSLLLPKTC